MLNWLFDRIIPKEKVIIKSYELLIIANFAWNYSLKFWQKTNLKFGSIHLQQNMNLNKMLLKNYRHFNFNGSLFDWKI